MFASRHILQRYHMTHERLLSGDAKSIERLEPWFDRQGLPGWFIVVKIPLLNKRGRPQGGMGVLRHTDESERRMPLLQTVSRAVEIIRQHYAKPLLLADLADMCGESLHQLQRKFQAAFTTSPGELLIKTRVRRSPAT